MTAVIIDDEKYCSDVLQILILKYCPQIEIVEIFNQSPKALEYLKSNTPDIIFLDIEMPLLNGFELLNKMEIVRSRVIFTTAYDQYAIKAFRFNAIDYLLKPIDKDELIEAIKKSSSILPLLQIENLTHLRSHHVPEKILLPIGNEILFVHVKDIICCEAEGSYCKVYCTNEPRPLLLSKSLREIEELLNNNHFFRPHLSWLIHETFIQKMVRGDAMEIILEGGIHVPVARSKRQEIINRLLR